MEYQIHYNKKFYLDKKTGYWISTTCPKVRAHVWVWKVNKGTIPKGFHIHHKDENKSNNNIENLSILSASEHLRHHGNDPIKKARSAKWCNIIRPLTKAWHASREGHQWHKKNGVICWQKREFKTFNCKQCNKKYDTKSYHQEFCSNACKSKWRRDQKIDFINKVCPVCQEIYHANKYSRSKTCGRKCGQKLLKSKIN